MLGLPVTGVSRCLQLSGLSCRVSVLCHAVVTDGRRPLRLGPAFASFGCSGVAVATFWAVPALQRKGSRRTGHTMRAFAPVAVAAGPSQASPAPSMAKITACCPGSRPPSWLLRRRSLPLRRAIFDATRCRHETPPRGRRVWVDLSRKSTSVLAASDEAEHTTTGTRDTRRAPVAAAAAGDAARAMVELVRGVQVAVAAAAGCGVLQVAATCSQAQSQWSELLGGASHGGREAASCLPCAVSARRAAASCCDEPCR